MPVLVLSPNGTITEKPSLVAAVLHPAQPNPLAVNIINKVIIVTTDQQLTQDVTLEATTELRITNNAVIDVPGGRNLTILGEFQKPHYNCFTGAGVISIPEAGPGPTQNWSIKNLIAAGTAAITGALNGLSAVFTSTVTASRFIGPLTGNVTGNADTATTATNASGTGTVPTADSGQRIERGSVVTDGNANATIDFVPDFAGVPLVVCTPHIASGGTGTSVHITGINAASATIQTRSGAANVPGVQVDWIAIGAR